MKKIVSALLAVLVLSLALAACGGGGASSSAAAPSSQPASSQVDAASSVPVSSEPEAEPVTMRIAGLKGPTTMGMVHLMQSADEGTARHDYQVQMMGTADELNPLLIKGELDIAALPANVASVLYNRTEGEIQVAAINTLGVLYVVEVGETVNSVEDLRGKTIYSTGKGTTPEYVLNYILTQNGLTPGVDVTIEYKAEATEVAAMLNNSDGAVAVLPQPYVSAVGMQNENLRIALDLTEEWDKVSPDSSLVTGVLVVRKAFAEENPEAFADFLEDYNASIEWVNANVADAAALVAQYGIVEKAPVAEKALPACNITYVDGAEMQARLSGYLSVLHEQKAEAVGGSLPEADFYYIGA